MKRTQSKLEKFVLENYGSVRNLCDAINKVFPDTFRSEGGTQMNAWIRGTKPHRNGKAWVTTVAFLKQRHNQNVTMDWLVRKAEEEFLQSEEKPKEQTEEQVSEATEKQIEDPTSLYELKDKLEKCLAKHSEIKNKITTAEQVLNNTSEWSLSVIINGLTSNWLTLFSTTTELKYTIVEVVLSIIKEKQSKVLQEIDVLKEEIKQIVEQWN